MISRDEILSKTGDGLEVFRHYISSDIRIGKYFCSPFYNDTKPSCNIYWNRKAMCFYFKDFGNADDVGDCFYYVGKVKGLDCHNPQHFIEILEIINHEMNLTLNNVKPTTRVIQSKSKEQPKDIIKPYSFTAKEFSNGELEFWGQYGINKMLLQEYNVLSLSEFKSVSSANKQLKSKVAKKNQCLGIILMTTLKFTVLALNFVFAMVE